MRPSFNTAGPCIEGEHYMLPPGDRFQHVVRLVDEGKFFTVHAGRQTGKTTSAKWLVDRLNEGDRFSALWVDIQTAREEPDPQKAFRTVLTKISMALDIDLPAVEKPDFDQLLQNPASAILRALVAISEAAPRPLVVFFDEADGLIGETMVSFLTQLRDGYINRRKQPFPQSVALVGMRQVRDYVLAVEERRAISWLGTTSPFNVTAEAATLASFTMKETFELLEQHTETTGQVFREQAKERIFELSQGHPWLVNAMADQIVNRDLEDRSVAVTADHVDAAKETIIIERRTHIDSLIARLREPRVQRVIEPMLTGGAITDDVLDDDFTYVRGLGLICERDGQFEIANPIYREVIPRALTYIRQRQISHPTAWYVRDDGSLDLPKLMAAWQKFWRQDGHLAASGFLYREAGPHLMLMAFMQRVVNGGGRVEREYGFGRGALDLMLFWREERHLVEVKLRRDTETEAEAYEQILRYLDQTGLDEGWLVLFDLRKGPSWQERTYQRDERIEGKLIRVVGC